MESAGALRRKPHHRQKLHLVLPGMRHLADELGDRATYLRTETYREALEQVGRPHADLPADNNRTARAVASMNRLSGLDAVSEQQPARESYWPPSPEWPRHGR